MRRRTIPKNSTSDVLGKGEKKTPREVYSSILFGSLNTSLLICDL